MRLNGWNYIPEGYGLRVDKAQVPLWLRVLHHTPFVDRFSYPLLVKRGHAYLVPHPSAPDHAPPPPGWATEPRRAHVLPLRAKNGA